MRSWSWVLAPLLSACASSFAPIDRASLPTAADHPEDGVAVLDDYSRVQFTLRDNEPVARRLHRRRVVVLTPQGSRHANLVGGYEASFDRVLSAEVRAVRPDGTTTTLGKGDLLDVPMVGVSFILYSSIRMVQSNLGVLPAGTVVDWQIETESTMASWANERFLFGDGHPVRSATFDVEVPDGWRVDHVAVKETRPFEWAPTITPIEGGRRLRWTKDHLAAYRGEPMMPSVRELAPTVRVQLLEWMVEGERRASFTTLEEYGRWMHQLQAGTDTLTPEIEAQAKAILAKTGGDPEATARAMYEFVQEQIRYVAIEVGLGGWRPHVAKDILHNGYGDCKDKANLLRTMLKVANIDSSMVSIYSHRGLPHRFQLPGVGNTNHAIIAVHLPGKTVLADPTTRTVPFGALPSNDQGAQVMLIDRERPVIETAPRSSAADNVASMTIGLPIPKKGVKANGVATLVLQGSPAWSARRHVLNQNKGTYWKIFNRYLWLRDKGSDRQTTFDISDPNKVAGVGQVTVNRLGVATGDRLVLRPGTFLTNPGQFFTRGPRRYPVVYLEPITLRTTVRFELGGATVSVVPEPATVTSEFGRFEQSWRNEDGNLYLDTTYVRTTTYVPATRYAKLLDFYEAITKAQSRQVVLDLGGMK